MTELNHAQDIIAQRFGRAAETYDEAASVQAQIVRHLVAKAILRVPTAPASVLDIGCGTGFAAAAVARQWPQAQITAIDGAPAMLEQARRKIPSLQIVEGDIAAPKFAPMFDLALSSMALHWLPDPRAALKRWCACLKPQGCLLAGLLVAGSFQEWRDLCAAFGAADGLWPFPPADFADGPGIQTERRTIEVRYPAAKDFLYRLKKTGASTPCPGHRPLAAPRMRRLLERAPRPFTVTYRVLYIEIQPSGSI